MVFPFSFEIVAAVPSMILDCFCPASHNSNAATTSVPPYSVFATVNVSGELPGKCDKPPCTQAYDCIWDYTIDISVTGYWSSNDQLGVTGPGASSKGGHGSNAITTTSHRADAGCTDDANPTWALFVRSQTGTNPDGTPIYGSWSQIGSVTASFACGDCNVIVEPPPQN